MGHDVLSSTTVLQSKNEPMTNISKVPILAAVLPSEPNVPLSLGSDISPTYDDVEPAPNPVLNPSSRLDAHSMSGHCAEDSSSSPATLGTFARIMHRFLPYLPCMTPDVKLPIGWITNNKLPVN